MKAFHRSREGIEKLRVIDGLRENGEHRESEGVVQKRCREMVGQKDGRRNVPRSLLADMLPHKLNDLQAAKLGQAMVEHGNVDLGGLHHVKRLTTRVGMEKVDPHRSQEMVDRRMPRLRIGRAGVVGEKDSQPVGWGRCARGGNHGVG
jgi:hypothetical protein